MKNMKIVAALIAVGLVSPMAYATNGTEMFAIGAESTALGGTGVANFMGAESTFANPAMLGKSKGAQVVGGVVYFKSDVTNTGMPTTPAQMGAGTGAVATSKANPSVIPDVSYSSRINDSLTYGIAMAGIAGMGVDYSGAPTNSHIAGKTAMSILHVVPTIAYNDKNYGVGFSPILQYGSLAISYNAGGREYNSPQTADSTTGIGFSLGGYYDVTPTLTVAAAYKSAIAMTYGKQLSGAGNGFSLCQPASAAPRCTGDAPFGDTLAQPAEMKVGVAYTISDVTLTADFKSIQWGSATGYKDFNWQDQTIYAIGAKYAGTGYWVGAGFNKANNPIAEKLPASGGVGYRNASVNFFNNLMFPATIENTMTFGGGYELSKSFILIGAAAISPEVKTTVVTTDVVGAFAGGPVPAQTNTTTHAQTSVSVSLRYNF